MKRGQKFTGRSYSARTDDRETFVGDYRPITDLAEMFADVDAEILLMDELERLVRLHAKAELTDTEFEEARRRLFPGA